MKPQHRLLKSWSRCLLIAAMLGCSALALAAPSALSRLEPGEMMVANAGAAKAATIATILNRWQEVATSNGQNAAVWRDVMSIQLSLMTDEGLAKLAALNPGADLQQQVTSYASFVSVLGADIGSRYIDQNKGTSDQKDLGSATVDLTFQPVPPCRLVDTRAVGGPIPGFGTRNFYGWSNSSTYDFGVNQGGVAGSIGTVCPNVYFATGFPTAAAFTVTVVNQGGPGNLIAWSGVGGAPTASALNYNATDAIANTTVVPMNVGRGTTSRDFAITVNAATSANVVVDVVGYFRRSQATALDCVTQTNPGNIGTGFVFINAASCPAGYTRTAIACETGPAAPAPNVVIAEVGFHGVGYCSFDNFSGATVTTGVTVTRCCRVPGL